MGACAHCCRVLVVMVVVGLMAGSWPALGSDGIVNGSETAEVVGSMSDASTSSTRVGPTGFSERWDDGVLGPWLSSTAFTGLAYQPIGGNGAGYADAFGSASASIDVGALTEHPDATGDFSGHAWTVRVDLRFVTGSFDAAWLRFRYLGPTENGWVFPLTADFPAGTWSTYSVTFDPGWTDSEARAAGWLTDLEATSSSAIPSKPFAVTLADVYTTEIRISGEGFLRVGIDNVRIEPAGILDGDGDGIPDDGDGSGNAGDHPCRLNGVIGCDDNCPLIANANQADRDGDGVGAVCEADVRFHGGVSLAQSVYDPDIEPDGSIDLVSARRAVASFVTAVDRADALGDSESLRVEVRNGATVLGVGSVSGADAKSGRRLFVRFASPEPGDASVTLHANGDDAVEESSSTNNQSERIAVSSRPTDSIEVAFFRGRGCSLLPLVQCYDAAPSPSVTTTASRGIELVQATFPVADGGASGSEHGDFLGSRVPFAGMAFDCVSVWTRGWLATRGRADQAVAVVSSAGGAGGPVGRGYFEYHGSPISKGIAFAAAGVAGVIVAEGYWSTVAHEIGHTRGLPVSGGEEYLTNPPGLPAAGYWVSRNRAVESATCFMGVSRHETLDGVWIDDDDYYALFRSTRESRAAEAEVLLVGGGFRGSAAPEFTPWYGETGGHPSDLVPGGDRLELLNLSRRVVSSLSFDARYEGTILPLGPIALPVAPFGLAAEFPVDAIYARFFEDGHERATVNIVTKLLHDAVDNLPEDCLASVGVRSLDPNRSTREVLHGAIDRLCIADGRLPSCPVVADPNFEALVRQIETRLPDSCVSEDPAAMTKTKFLNLAEMLRRRLDAQGR